MGDTSRKSRDHVEAKTRKDEQILPENGYRLPKAVTPATVSQLEDGGKGSGINKTFLAKLLRDFLRRFMRGGSFGVGLYAGVRLVSALLRNPFRQTLPDVWRAVVSTDCARVASFFGLYPSIYHMMVDVLRAVRTQKDGWTYGISGAVAGLSIAILDESRRKTVTFFTVARALGALVSTLVARGHLGTLPFLEVWVFCACVSVIVYCTALKPQYLTPGYYRSIVKWSRDYSDEKLEKLFRVQGDRFLTCEEAGLHEGPCVRQRFEDCLRSLPGFAKLYLPIHLTPVLLFKRKVLKERPWYVLRSLAKNMVISTAFLGVMCSLAKLTICVLRDLAHLPPPLPSYIPAVAGAVCGLALILERFSRRKELSLFVLPHTFNILYIALKRSRFASSLKVPHGFTLAFALSMSSIMHAFEREPDSLTILIQGILRFFVGCSSNTTKATMTTSRKTDKLG
ncbi:uncharacterized protein LOC101854933 [Aplysia californica]|uniref:Uncharacterized protein LOC101854933 n=1 Tax=Aplysia californica TaxID=6500 RepID=A0ABM0ZV88_APLCA|nr:uncharacterized protein LOC101854933 [Aplysia californica]